MAGVRQLSPQEVVFVGGEAWNVYQHTSGLVVLDGDGRPDFGAASIRRHLEERLVRIPQFRWRLHEVPFGLDLPYWVEDEEFSFDNHIRRVAVPTPGDRREIAALVSYLYSRHLDRRRPPWETWIIEGLEGGRYGLFSKLHHCMMDGEGASQLGMAINDLEPDPAEPLPIDPAILGAEPGRAPDRVRETLTAARHLSTLPSRATREAISAARKVVAGLGNRRPPTPTTVINGPVGRERGFVFGSLPLADVKSIKNRHGVTVNDVLLALIGGSLRRYLLDRDALPDDSMRTAIAVSLRDGDDTFSNQVTTVSVTLATDVADPVERVLQIAADTERAKQTVRAGDNQGLLEIASIFPPAVIGALISAAPPTLAVQIAGANLIISNVRGSPIPLYVGGGRTLAMYPMSILLNGSGINATCISYVDDINVGMTIDPRLVDEPWSLVDGLTDELAALSHRPVTI